MSLPVYMYEDNYHGRPWNRKSVPQQQTRRISFDSFVERPKMHSRTPSIDSSISSLSSGRNRLQKVCTAPCTENTLDRVLIDCRKLSTIRRLHHGHCRVRHRASRCHRYQSGIHNMMCRPKQSTDNAWQERPRHKPQWCKETGRWHKSSSMRAMRNCKL